MAITAQTTPITNPVLSENMRNLSAGGFIQWFTSSFIKLIMGAGFITMIFYFLFGGFMWITSGGEVKRNEAAGKQITNAVIGMLIIAIGWAIITVVDKFLNLNILEKGVTIPKIAP